jgi:predicted transcriptional regulator
MTTPPATDGVPEPGYDKWLKGEIAEGLADIEAGRVTPAEAVWNELNIE